MLPDDEPGPPYARIVAELRRRIAIGAVAPGERLPSTRQIVREWGVAMATASKVLATLQREGLAEAMPGIGTVVLAQRRPRGGRPTAEAAASPQRIAGRTDAEVLRDRIVRTATGIADAEGLAATTMRRVATHLDMPTMSLYRQIHGRDHLMVLMADAAFAEQPLPARPPAGWRAQLELLCRLQWAMYQRHPWLAQVVSLTRPLLAPHAIAHTEWAMRAVTGQGLDMETVVHVAATVASYVRGTAVNLEREAEAEQDTGLTDDEWLRVQQDVLAAALRSGAFPILSAVSARSDVDLNIDTLFEFGLQRMLDGVATLIGACR
ncbi:TetR/AcrR family transcriptional regulator C-terminal domain-containing protein [Micromonospora sp. NPDC050200]|uniref:TetR/AcrR family transcriptional regulator C-terminal domain-containing protein n=1 Tax=Micromonospora sp. NPDC050200 TaxID=3155664 RepID=UPI0033CF94E3